MPKGPRKFHFSFEKSGLTRFGGLSLFQSFCKSLGLRHFLQLYVRWPKYHHKDYHPADLFLAHLFAIVTGIGRIENTQALIHNGLIPPLLGLPEFPHRDTLRSFLWRFGPNELHALVAAHDRLRQELFFRLGLRYSAIIDADTTALITYGSQEGTAVGYVPKRRHSQPSYAPIISSENRFEFGHGTQSRQCARFLWSLGFPQASPGQIAFLDRFHAHTGASRWSFLRQKHRPVSRYQAARLWHCGSNVPTVEKPYGRSSIPRVCSRLGSRSVLLHAASVERRTRVCGRTQAHRFGNRRDPATTVHLQKVHLSSSFGNELGADGGGGLAFLLRPGVSRAFAARVQRLVCHGQDSYPQLVGQCRLHGNDPVGLRLGFGFPVSLFARRSSSLEYRYASPRTLVVAGRMDQARQSQPLDASVEVPSPKSLPQNPTCYHQGQGADLNQFATLWIASSVVGERN